MSICACVHANDMMHLMKGGYDAKTMSVEEIQKALEGEGATTQTNNATAISERYSLEYTNKQQVFRHSFYADYYLYDHQKHDTIWLTDQPIRDAVMSPNRKYVVYAKADNNLYIYKVDFRTEVAITTTAPDIFNGVSDWLYEEEFGITQLFAFSPDNKMLAFVRLDEKAVPNFEWQTFLEGDKTKGDYPKLSALRYPRAGEANAVATLCVYDIYYKTIQTIDLGERSDYYIPRILWREIPQKQKGQEQKLSELVVLVLNRDQTRMDVLVANPKSTVSRPLYSEQSTNYYVDYALFDQWQWLSDGKVVLVSEKGGYYQAYLYDKQGKELGLLTPENRDVTQIYGVDEQTMTLYYQAAIPVTERHGFALNMKKSITTQLTSEPGTHALHFSKDWKRYVDCYQSVDMPNRYTLYETKGNQTKGKVLLDNDSVLQAWEASGLPNKEFFMLTTERGDKLHGWMIKPTGFDQTKQWPVVMMQYSGPASQRATNTWRKRFGHFLAQEGYLVVCVDGRGTNARGRDWRNASYMNLGQMEAEDQISVAKYLKTLPYVDGNRMAICGWSYGGYQTLMCLSKQQEMVWQCGIAIAPVTSWRLYDSAYTERYMRRPQVNEFGYRQADVINLAKDLKGSLLLVHGTADDNVHMQHAWEYVDALVDAGKQFEMQFYPDDNHFLRNGNNYEHLHNRIILFLKNNL